MGECKSRAKQKLYPLTSTGHQSFQGQQYRRFELQGTHLQLELQRKCIGRLYSVFTFFQSKQDDRTVIMKGSVQFSCLQWHWNTKLACNVRERNPVIFAFITHHFLPQMFQAMFVWSFIMLFIVICILLVVRGLFVLCKCEFSKILWIGTFSF